MRQAANRDVNHDEIRLVFEGQGCSVQTLHRVGGGVPDLLVGIPGSPALNLLVEVKRGDDGPKHGELNEEQVAWFGRWRGQAAVIHNELEAIALLKAARAWQAGVASA